jgi:ParB family chromosome partitioning protein
MSERHRGLGRGLSALLGVAAAEVAVADEAAAARVGANEIAVDLIARNPDQPRKIFTEAEVDELAASIREKGVLQPILVRPAPGEEGRYQIVAGERRWRAAQKAGLRAVPVLIRDLDDIEVLEIAIVENVQRSDLNAIEEAMAYRALMDRFGRTQDAVAQVVGKSRSHVANTLRLLALPDEVQDHVLSGRLSAGHARALVSQADAVALAEQMIQGGVSVRQAEEMVREQSARRPGGGASSSGSGRPGAGAADIRALEQDLGDVLGLDVLLKDRGGKGELTIRYGTLEQLDDLCRRLMRSGPTP